jgi:SAM-dependent methyltransferase
MEDYYNKDYHPLVHGHHFKDDKYYWARAEASTRLNFRGVCLSADTSVLEFGCGYGHNIACLGNAWGYDVSDLARGEAARHGVRVYSSIGEIPTSAFDIVLSRHCLEHLENPLENLRLLATFLIPNGTLILILPKESHTKVSYNPDVNQHLFSWNFRTINNLLVRAGYQVSLNKFQSVVGYRAFLPVRKYLGKAAYFYLTLLAGRFFGITELVIHAHKTDLPASPVSSKPL